MNDSTPSLAHQVNEASFEVERVGDLWTLRLVGDWTVAGVENVDGALRKLMKEHPPGIVVESSGVSDFDTAGAWLIDRIRREMQDLEKSFSHRDENVRHLQLVEVIQDAEEYGAPDAGDDKGDSLGLIARFGRVMVEGFQDMLSALAEQHHEYENRNRRRK